MKHARILALGTFAAALMTFAPSAASLGGAAAEAAGSTRAKTTGSKVDVRVEGIAKTLLAETAVSTKPASIDKDGKPADVCEGDTAAVALQDATSGRWTAGAFSSGLGYPVMSIEGESYPFTADYYWSFWVDDKPATTGVCGATVHKGERLLFFPQCSKESAASCPQGMFDPAVLSIVRLRRARAGKAVALKVSSLDNLTGKPSPGIGVKLSGGGHTATTDSSGKAKLTFAKAGSYKIVATAPDSVRDELTLTVTP